MRSLSWREIGALLAAPVSCTAVAQASAPPPSVIVTEVISKDITPQFHYVGRVEAKDKVELRARVEGFLEQRKFQEGGDVSQGDLLFVLEKAPYEVLLEKPLTLTRVDPLLLT